MGQGHPQDAKVGPQQKKTFQTKKRKVNEKKVTKKEAVALANEAL